LAPHEPVKHYLHNRTGEDNADAHLKRQIMGREVVVAITKGKLDFGPWERIFYGEFDGRRQKRVLEGQRSLESKSRQQDACDNDPGCYYA
jgi:secondary thiamine-phosphate synthase enzyme